ncbi:MAG: hypothetical protein ABIP49_05850, partial [Lysobacterales bacterium]
VSMSAPDGAKAAGAGRSRAGAFALCALLAIAIGFTMGLNIARRLVPPPTEARLVMQLLEVEQIALNTDAARRVCASLPPERMRLLTTLIDLIPMSMRDTLVVDAAFDRQVQRLRDAIHPLADVQQNRDCPSRRRVLNAIDSACRDCHRQFRSGG